MSQTKETFLDLLHLAGMMMSNGRSMPSELFLDKASYKKWCESQERIRLKILMQAIKKQQLCEMKEKGNMIIFNISEKGMLEAIKQEILSERSELPEGSLCVVSFDIPEVVEKSRKAFRDFLKKAGFKQLHRSVWQSNLNVIQPLKVMVKQLEIEKWVTVFQAIG
ncbi:MAG: hypothetical protein ABIG32_03555 [Candidatus Uhrbacteria bacterium]|nr:hypothetical protein [Patescibacteria group bacterium]MBU1907400.1 hypothetical protein [Patescibacteria group bacterium]